MAQKRFSRKTQGVNAHVIVAKAINITTDATLALFLANAPLGEIGVYDADGALHTNLITAAEEFFFIIKTTEGVKRTSMMKFSEMISRKKLYVAPVKQVASIGWTGTGGSLHTPAIAAGQLYSLKVIETTEGYDPFPTWTYDEVTKTGDAVSDVVQRLAKKINNDDGVEHKQNARLCTAKVKADATYGNLALGAGGTLTVTNGSDVITTAVGTADIALNDFLSFDAAAAPTDNIGDIYKVIELIDANNFRLGRVFTGATQTFTEAEAEGTRVKRVTAFVESGLQLTTIDADINFRLAVQEEFADADVNQSITAFVKGNGTYLQVAALEKEGNTFAGETTQNAAFASKYGTQDLFAVDGETYDYYMFNALQGERGTGNEAVHYERKNIIIAVAKSAGDVDTSFNTYFAL